MATSVWEAERQATEQPKCTKPEDYARLPKKAKDYDLADAKALFGEYRPLMRDFYLSNQQGRFMLNVSDESVTVTAYGGDCAESSRIFTLAAASSSENTKTY